MIRITREGISNALKAYGTLASTQASIDKSMEGLKHRANIARQMSDVYSAEIAGRREAMDMPLMAVSAADTLGTLTGALVAQKALELFRYQYPMFTRVYHDLSSLPASFGQEIVTRVIGVPSVNEYNPTHDATGRPIGWALASAAQTSDVTTTLDKHVGVPIVLDANTLASTTRRLFEEVAPAALYALAAYFTAKVYALMTPANFNGYAAVAAKVPVAYPTFNKAPADFGRSSFVDLNRIFNQNEVPLQDRSCILNSEYFAAAGKDPSLLTFWAAERNPEIVTKGELPKMSQFVPIEAPDLPTTNNLTGFAMQRAAIVAVARVPADYSKALGDAAAQGIVLTISDPETGMSVRLVQYVDHKRGFAEFRMEALLGASVGDKRGGLCITS